MTDTNKCYLCHRNVVNASTASQYSNRQWYCSYCDYYFMAIQGAGDISEGME